MSNAPHSTPPDPAARSAQVPGDAVRAPSPASEQPSPDAESDPARVASHDIASHDIASAARSAGGTRIDVDEETPARGLAHLVLTLIKLIHDLLEKQAVGRMERGTLSDAEVERVGRTLMKQAEELERLCEVFGLDLDDLHLDLGTIHHPDGSPPPAQ